MTNALLQGTIEFLKLYWAPLLCGVAVVAILPLIVGYIVLVKRGLAPCAWGRTACCSPSPTP